MANNQYVNKVVFGDETLIDLSSDTVTSGQLINGYTAHDKSGAPITGIIPIRNAQSIASGLGWANGMYKITIQSGAYEANTTLGIPVITIPVPTSGTNSISIWVPNGTTTPSVSNDDDWIPITFTVDSVGNSNVTEQLLQFAEGVKF